MANIKFSAFTQKVVQTNVDFLVGYTGADNVRITPAALGDGIYLPLGGGTMVGNLNLNDSVVLQIGSSADLQLFHELNNSYISNYIGDLTIRNLGNDKYIIFQSDDGSGGVATYFYLDGSAANPGNYLITLFPDNSRLVLGDGWDIQMWHDGVDGKFYNATGDWSFEQAANDKDIIFYCDDGAGGTTPYLTLDGSLAQMWVDKDLQFSDNIKAKFGASSDLEIYHDGSNSYITDQGTGRLIIKTDYFEIDNAAGTEAIIEGIENGAVNLYYDSAKKLETTTTGIQVTDEVSIGTSLVHTGDTDTKVSFGTDEIVLTTAGTDAVTVDSSGDVGIGSSAPTAKLQLKNTAVDSITQIAFTNDARTYNAGVHGGLSDSFNIYDITASATRFLINTSGNVGIGTTSPGAKLNVAGDVLIDSGEYISWGTVGATSIEGSTASNKLQFRTNSSDRMIIDSAGNVGIGTATPTAALQVVGLVEYADNAAALLAGLTAGAFYRTGDLLKVVH